MRDEASLGEASPRLASASFKAVCTSLRSIAMSTGLENEIERASLERVDCGIDIAVRRDHRNRRFRIPRVKKIQMTS